MRKDELLKIFATWLVFTIVINSVPFLLSSISLISIKEQTFKELGFAAWGYGWDGGNYLNLVKNGYKFPLQAFFPLYPLLLYLINLALPLTLTYRINILLSFGMLLSCYKLAKLMGLNEKEAMMGVCALLFFPGSFFLQANYTETLFILLSSLALYFSLKGKSFPAMLMSGFTTGVKLNGIGLSLALLLKFVKSSNSKFKYLKLLGYTFLANVGVILYFLYLEFFNKGFQVFFRAQSEWGRNASNAYENPFFLLGLVPRLYNSGRNLDPWFTREVLEVLVFGFVVYLLFSAYKKISFEVLAYCALQVLIPLISGSLLSFPRLMLLTYPLLLLFGKKLQNPLVLVSYIFIATIAQAIMLFAFFNNVFIA